ncbi:MAG: hypothetical protein ACOCXH_13195, partial [Cyclobacteriaceae bacterium]
WNKRALHRAGYVLDDRANLCCHIDESTKPAKWTLSCDHFSEEFMNVETLIKTLIKDELLTKNREQEQI